MVKIRKKTSKRVGFREKASCLKKVKEHHRKLRKHARKYAEGGVKPHKGKKPSIPNSFPNKEMLINEMENEFIEAQEMKKREKQNETTLIHAQTVKNVTVNKQIEVEDFHGGLTKEQFDEAQNLIDPEGVEKANVGMISKKGQTREIRQVIEKSDVVVQVLDARDPEGSRCTELEEQIKEGSKKLIFILNKIDLVPEEVVDQWINHYKQQKILCLKFKATGNLAVKKEEGADKDVDMDEKDESGRTMLMDVLFEYARKFADKQEKDMIAVGVIGYTNAGKSSVINCLKRRAACATSSNTFLTKTKQEVRLNQMVTLVDTPGIVHISETAQEGTQVIRSALQVEQIENPLGPLKSIFDKIEKVELLRHYRIGGFETVDQFLEQIARKKGFIEKVKVPTEEIVNTLVKKKGKMVKSSKKIDETIDVPDKDMAARRVIRDFLSNRLSYYTKPPQAEKAVTKKAEVAKKEKNVKKQEEEPKSKAEEIKPASKKITRSSRNKK